MDSASIYLAVAIAAIVIGLVYRLLRALFIVLVWRQFINALKHRRKRKKQRSNGFLWGVILMITIFGVLYAVS